MMKNISNNIITVLIFFLLTTAAQAETVVFSKKVVTILTTAPLSIEAVEELTKQAEEEQEELPDGRRMPEENLVVEPKPEAEKVRVSYEVKVRNTEFLNSGIIDNSRFDEGKGLLIEFEAPQVFSVPVKNIFSPRDIIFINDKNQVSEIFPYVSVESEQNVIPTKAAKALLQINGGDTTTRNIQVGDKIIFE